mgnify:CR=1 FL=1
MSNFDKIFLALCKLSSSTLVCLHEEAKGYAFKTFSGEWRTVSFDFGNSIAGLGSINRSLI